MILTLLVILVTCIYLFLPKDIEVTEITQPMPATQEQNQAVQATETIQEPANSIESTSETLVQPKIVNCVIRPPYSILLISQLSLFYFPVISLYMPFIFFMVNCPFKHVPSFDLALTHPKE
jgi:hypothetical protein